MKAFQPGKIFRQLLTSSYCLLLLIDPRGVITLSWNPNNEPDLAGYKIYYGTVSREYSEVIDAGNVTTYRIEGLSPEVRYFFAITAYDAAGNESDFSQEVSTHQDNRRFSTSYNFPNPFNPEQEVTHIRYVMEKESLVTITIYNLSSDPVAILLTNVAKSAGEHIEDIWDGKDERGHYVAAGIYFCKIETNDYTHVIKIAVTR
jgi:hypothetical protein